MVDNFVPGTVETGCKVSFGHGHADGIGKTLSQRAGSCFHSRGVPEFRVPGGFALPLPEIFNVIKG